MLYGIQYLRGVAALLVVLLHARLALDSFLYQTNQRTLIIGNSWIDYIGKAGVDIFFVISGLVISITLSKINHNSTLCIRDFLIRRFIRLTPIFWIVLSTHIALTAYISSGLYYRPLNIISTALYLPSMNASGIITTALPVSWTLNYEMLFYISMAVFAVLAGRFARLAVCIQFIVFACIFYAIGNSNLDMIQRHIFNPQSLEFVMGIAIGWAYQRGMTPNPKVSSLLVIIGIASFSGIYFKGFGDGYIGRVILAGIPSALIVYGLLFIKSAPKNILTKVMAAIGDSSYSLYLIHITIFMVMSWQSKSLGLIIDSRTDYITAYTALIITACIGGFLLYKYVEAPVTSKLNSLVKR